MKNNYFEKFLNFEDLSHAYLFECKPSKEFNEEINNLIKKILCVDKQKNFMFCDLCSSCKSFNGNTNPDFLEIFPDENLKTKVIGISTLRGDTKKNRGIINIMSETALLSDAKLIKINDAELLNDEAQGHLLKVLEEPPKNSYIFLLSSKPSKLNKTILSRLNRIKIDPSYFENEEIKNKLDPLFYEILFREFDTSSIDEVEIEKLKSIYAETIDSIEEFNFSKTRVLDLWNDDYLNFRLNILKQNIFNVLSNKFKDSGFKDASAISSLNEEKLFLFLEELISFQALLANKVPINKKIQLSAIFDFV
tara:strand:- start:5899 stop:6819 length:921 start_codon:yes stop_codon:yes gene_type:complete